MTRIRAWLMVLIGAIATFVVGCSGVDSAAEAAKAAAQAANLEIYVPAVVELRDRFPEVEPAFANKKWRDIQTFVHGPLGELRQRMARVSRNLPDDQQKSAAKVTSDLLDSLLAMDEAAGRFNYVAAEQEYEKAIAALDAFLELVPTNQPQEAS
ncbi:MAG: photosystem II protein PsbQ [Cyanophyceae cyanobacterium]